MTDMCLSGRHVCDMPSTNVKEGTDIVEHKCRSQHIGTMLACTCIETGTKWARTPPIMKEFEEIRRESARHEAAQVSTNDEDDAAATLLLLPFNRHWRCCCCLCIRRGSSSGSTGVAVCRHSGGGVATTVVVVVVWLFWLLHPQLSIVVIVVLLLLLLLLALHVGTLRVPCSLLIVVFFPLFVIVIFLGPPWR